MKSDLPSPALSRRMLLTSAVSGLALAACGGGSSDSSSPTRSGSTTTPGNGPNTPVPAASVQAEAMEATGLGDAELVLSPQLTWGELIVAPDQYIQFVVTDQSADGALVTDPVQFWLVDADAQVVAGPVESHWFPDDRLPTGGLHSVKVTVAATGVLDVVVATADGASAGTGALQAMAAAQSLAPGPGEVIAGIDTATVANPQGLEDLCTRQPDCDLHDLTLTQALAAGPTVLCIATPAFCSSAICGPVLDDVLTVADSSAFPNVSFVHVEPYSDAGVTVTPIVEQLALPSEPWTFVLATDGTVIQRFAGPVLPDILTEILAGMPTA